MTRKKIIEIVLDIETTGLDYTKEKMIEFAAVRLENGKIKDKYQTLINPQQHIRRSSFEVHHISEEMVQDAPTEEEVMPKILEFVGDYPIVGHNVIFDYSFINEASLRL
ncbi:3'-5' exonuclease, partial [bacterium]|nr:3'-5' exonuclease [bacterium]